MHAQTGIQTRSVKTKLFKLNQGVGVVSKSSWTMFCSKEKRKINFSLLKFFSPAMWVTDLADASIVQPHGMLATLPTGKKIIKMKY